MTDDFNKIMEAARQMQKSMAEAQKHLFTSESVTEGHPDKIADQISDGILDAMIAQDKYSRVACETILTTGIAFVAGEISTKAYVEIPDIIRDVIKDFGTLRVLDGVSFDVPAGEIVVLLGPSGCGKTTTLRCVAGLEHPTGGRISIGERVVSEPARGLLVNPRADAYAFPLCHYILGRHDPRAYYWPEHHIRLFRKGAVRFGVTVHDSIGDSNVFRDVNSTGATQLAWSTTSHTGQCKITQTINICRTEID